MTEFITLGKNIINVNCIEWIKDYPDKKQFDIWLTTGDGQDCIGVDENNYARFEHWLKNKADNFVIFDKDE